MMFNKQLKDAFLCLTAGILGGFAAYRTCTGAMWIDEITSWGMATSIESWTDIFLAIHWDNNHYLNTLWMYCMGPDAPEWAYRMISLIARIGLVVALGLSNQLRHWPKAMPLAATLGAASFFLTQHGSAARGYAMAMLFIWLAWEFLLHHQKRPNLATALAYSLAATLSFLSHLSAFQVLLAMGAYSLLTTWMQKPTSLRQWGRSLSPHLPVAVAFIILWWADLRHINIIGGWPTIPWQEAIRALEMTMGAWGAIQFIMVLPALGIWAWGVGLIKRDGGHEWTIHPIAALASTAIIVLLNPPFVYPRYFMPLLPFVLHAHLRVASLAFTPSASFRRLAFACSLLILTGNILASMQFARHGRGDFRAVLRDIGERTPSAAFTLIADNDSQARPLTKFYSPRILPDRELKYLTYELWPKTGADWLLTNSFNSAPEEFMYDIHDNRYTLVGEVLHFGESGYDWRWYRLDNP